MKIIQLVADNFKRLVAVEITPEGHVIEIKGKNGAGKSSVLDAIYVALAGRSAAPPKPIRNGEEQCRIRLDMGELIVTRTFTAKQDGAYTDTLKVENAEGLRYGKPQEVLDALLGEIGFDPFEFCQMKAAEQAEALLRLVPLPVDLDELAEQDESDYLKRRDTNRDLSAVRSQLAAIPKEELPDTLPDRPALLEALGNAANTNAEIERSRLAREATRSAVVSGYERVKQLRDQIARLTVEADALESDTQARDNQLGELKPLPELVDTDALRSQLAEADRLAAAAQRQSTRKALITAVDKLEADSQALTDAMAVREKTRQEALAQAKMPIEGLGFQVNEKGKPLVTFNGVPFEQASSAEQLRASTAIAMAANPSLRVLRIKDGSLLDDDAMKLLADMAETEDFQLFVERVGTGGVGIVMENGAVAEAKAAAKPKAKEKDAKPEGALV